MTTTEKEPISAPDRDTDESADGATPASALWDRRDSPARVVPVRLSTLLAGAVVTALLIGCAVLGGLWWSARADLHAAAVVADNAARAERTATEYAVGAATVDYQHMDEWIVRLKANTTSVLANKFDATGPKLGEILAPLQWTSTATPVAAKVMSDKNGVYVVDVFLNVTSSSSQSPAGTQTTVTYSITLDRGAGWMISDVGGMTAALPSK